MALNIQNFQNWDVEMVTHWLAHINLAHLVPAFEQFEITGTDLSTMDDVYMKEQLKIGRPAELTALKGAISNLVDTAATAPQKKKSARHESIGTRSPNTMPGSPGPPNASHHSVPPRNYTISTDRPSLGQPTLKRCSAQELLDDQVTHSGWITKQGGSYKNWRRRYLILRMGCLYYYANETAGHTKGMFTLTGYRCSYCNDPKITGSKYRWCLGIQHMNPGKRTYYFATASKREMESWKSALDGEIMGTMKSVTSPVTNLDRGISTGSDVAAMDGEGSSGEDDPDDPENIYDEPNEDAPYDIPEDPLYDTPPHDDSDSDDPYSQINDDPLPNPFPHASPPNTAGAGAPIRSFTSVDRWAANRPQRGVDVPHIPPRSDVSLLGKGEKPVRTAVSPAAPRRRSTPNSMVHEVESDPTYLPVVTGSAPPRHSELELSPPSPARELIVRDGREIRIPSVESAVNTVEEERMFEDEEGYQAEDVDDTYYIMFKKPEELMPPSCVFDRLDRVEADRLLRSKNRDGTYLIRAGVRAGSEKVLSVWHIDRCRHYKLFKDEHGSYSLTQGHTFKTIPEVLQHYSLQEQLPRSEFYLGDPYNPQDF